MTNKSNPGKQGKKSIFDSFYEIVFSRYKGTNQQIADIEGYKDQVEEHIYPTSKLGTKIRFLRNPKYENNILAYVYLGAAFLVVVLGLRGMGEDMPLEFLKDSSGKLYSGIIVTALLVESFMICWLAATNFFKLEEHDTLFSLIKGPQDKEAIYKVTYDRVIKEVLDLNMKMDKMAGMSQSQQIDRENEIRKDIQVLFSKLF